MVEVVSIVLAASILIGLVLFALVLGFEVFCRLRDRSFKPETQLRRADLGFYPHWRK